MNNQHVVFQALSLGNPRSLHQHIHILWSVLKQVILTNSQVVERPNHVFCKSTSLICKGFTHIPNAPCKSDS